MHLGPLTTMAHRNKKARAELIALADAAEATGKPLEASHTTANPYLADPTSSKQAPSPSPRPPEAVEQIAAMLTPREFGALLRAGRTGATRSLQDGYRAQALAWALVDT